MISHTCLIGRRSRRVYSVLCPRETICRFPTVRRGSVGASFSSKHDNNTNGPNTTDRVGVEIDASTGICHVRLNRPDKLNAFDLPMFEAVAETARNLKSDRSIRVVILSGKGRAFSTGLDVKATLKDGNPMKTIQRLLERQSRPSSGFLDDDRGDNDDDTCSSNSIITSNLAQDVSIMWRELNVPVIAVLQGMCYGAGLQVALGADFRYSTPDCQISIMEGKWVRLTKQSSVALACSELNLLHGGLPICM